jgi:hypothetical protein
MYVGKVNFTVITREDPLFIILKVNGLLMTTASKFLRGSSVMCNNVVGGNVHA